MLISENLKFVHYNGTDELNEFLCDLFLDNSPPVREQLWNCDDVKFYFRHTKEIFIILFKEKPIGYISYKNRVFETQLLRIHRNSYKAPLCCTYFLNWYFNSYDKSITTYIHERNTNSLSLALRYGWKMIYDSEEWTELELNQKQFSNSELVQSLLKRTLPIPSGNVIDK